LPEDRLGNPGRSVVDHFQESNEMAYVIAEPCIGTKDTSCADVCPVDCIHPAAGEANHEQATMLYIDPAECIDCDACVEACPVDATMSEDDVPAQFEIFKEINKAYFEQGPEAGEKMVAEYLASKA
jgi:ferredoxin